MYLNSTRKFYTFLFILVECVRVSLDLRGITVTDVFDKDGLHLF